MSTVEPSRVVRAGGNPIDAPARDEIDFAGVLGAFRRRWLVYVIVFVATLLATAAYLILYPPDYISTARVLIDPRNIASTPNGERPVVSQLPPSQFGIDTEAQVIKSKRVAARVVKILNLESDPQFTSNHVGFSQSLSDFFIGILHGPRAISPQDRLLVAVLGNLKAQRYLETNTIDISYRSKDPAKAQKLANAFAEAYLDDQLDTKTRKNQQAADALMGQIDAMRRQASSDSEKVQAYKIAHGLLSVGSQTLTEQEISGYDQAVATAKAEAAADQASLHTAQEQLTRGSSGEDVGAALNSGVVGALRAQRAALTSKLAVLEGHYGPKYPDLAQARREVASIDLDIEAEILRTVSNLAAKANISQKRLASLQGTLSSTKRTLAENNGALAGLEDLVRAASVSQSIYESYLQRFKESTAQLSSLVPDAEIVSMAGLPMTPSTPVVWLFLLLGAAAGALFGAVAVLTAEVLDDRLNTADDVERKLGRPFVGAVPRLASLQEDGVARPIEAIFTRPLSSFSEALRGLLASLKFAGPVEDMGVVMVTSARSQDGKSTLSACLARTLAMQGVSTLLIDADVRGRGMGFVKSLAIEDRGPGLVELLKGNATLAEVLRRDEETGVMLLPMSDDPQPSNELIGGAAMEDLLVSLRGQFRSIIIDGPILSIATARLLAAKADLILLVAPWRAKADEGLLAAVRLPPLDRAPHVGVVLNGLDEAQQVRYGFGRPARFDKKRGKYYNYYA